MASPAVTYSFSNGTTADATQVNQNFTDLIASLTDGTKSLVIDALTANGAAIFNGAVTLGNGSADDITVTGSLAASVPIKTNNSFDIGSATLGLAGVYLGSAGGLTTRIKGGATGSSYTLTTPTALPTNKRGLSTTSAGVMAADVVNLENLGVSASVGSNALTIALKTAAGSDASATEPITIKFRSATAATGTPVYRDVTAALSVVVSSGSTLGHTSGVAHNIWLYALDNAGTVELAVSQTLRQPGIYSTTTEGGAGAADSNTTIYSTTARADVPMVPIGRLVSNQVTAGTWAAVPTSIQLFNNAIAASEVISARYKSTAGQVVAQNVITIIDFGTKEFDSHGSVTTGAAWKFTAPSPGRYRISAGTENPNGSAVYGTNRISIYKNGSQYSSRNYPSMLAAAVNISHSITDSVDLLAGEYIDIRLLTDKSGGATLSTTDNSVNVSVERIGGVM